MKPLHAAVLTLSLALTGCYKSWVELSGAADAPARPALLVSSAVIIQQDGEKGALEAAVNIMDNSELGKVGPQVADQLDGWLEARGYDLVVDAERARRIQVLDMGEFANDVAPLTGAWFDPRASTSTLDNRTLNRRAYTRKLAEQLDDPEVEDAYVFVVVTVSEKAPAILLKRPALDVSLLVVDEQGEDLLRARGWGFGNKDLMVVRNDAENLGIALEAAIANLETAEVKPTRAPKE